MIARTRMAIVKMALVGGIALSGSPALAGESADPIKIAVNNWASQLVLAHISGTLLQQAGYNVEYHPVDAQLQFPAIGNGDLHLQVEIWQGTMQQPFEQQVARQRMIDAGAHSAVSREDWWYPDYVEEFCPGLPDWQALNECADQFATPETEPLGRYLAGRVDWEWPDRERIEALGLEFQYINVTDAHQLWAALDEASRNQQPIVLWNWTPNWTETKYQGKFVEFPAYEPECETEWDWGINPYLTHDCGNPARGWLKKGVWGGLPEKWSCAFELIKNIDFNNEQIATVAAYAEVDEMSPEEAALRWIAENPEVWETWMPKCAGRIELMAAAEETTPEAPAEADAVDAETLAQRSNCLSCHRIDQSLVGPGFKDIAAKYKDDDEAADLLVAKIKNGGVGNWGEIPMPPNPGVPNEDIKTLVDWILAM